MKFAYALSLTLIAATLSLAQERSVGYVSIGLGTDSIPEYPCTAYLTPCQTLQHAVDLIPANGLIVILDSGPLPPVKITKSVTIDGKGVGTIEACLTDGVTATNADHVEIRNLAIHVDAGCIGVNGISAESTYMTIRNVSISGGALYGVSLRGGTHAVIHGLTVTGPTYGIRSGDQIDLTVSDSDIQYATVAISVFGERFPTSAMIERTRLASNLTGLEVVSAGSAATVRISDCVIFGNSTGVATSLGAQVITLRNNVWLGNITDGTTAFSASLK